MHQGYVLSPLLTILLEALSRDFRKGLPCKFFYPDDLALLAQSRQLLMEWIKI